MLLQLLPPHTLQLQLAWRQLLRCTHHVLMALQYVHLIPCVCVPYLHSCSRVLLSSWPLHATSCDQHVYWKNQLLDLQQVMSLMYRLFT